MNLTIFAHSESRDNDSPLLWTTFSRIVSLSEHRGDLLLIQYNKNMSLSKEKVKNSYYTLYKIWVPQV